MPKPRREGYLLIDNRNSPGVSADFIHKSGVEASAVGPGVTFESATMTCAHCNAVVILNPDRKRARGYCARCDQYVCDKPECALECVPFERILEDVYNKNQRNLLLGE